MSVWLAKETLVLLDRAISQDDGNAWRAELRKTLPQLDDAYRDDEQRYRSHLGASVLGRTCERSVWYGWRWAYKRAPKGRKFENAAEGHARMVRLYNRGHLEEGRIVAMLRVAGLQVYQYDADGKQFRISDFGGHFGSAIDSAIVGCPDLPPGVPCLGEFKTYADKYFQKLLKEGVRESKPEHYAQMQVCMRRMGLFYGLYLAVNKNDDELYAEIVQYDAVVSDAMMERARRIIFADESPDRIRNASPGYYVCKMCDHADVCFRTVQADKNCRTCKHSAALPDGQWVCRLNGDIRDKEAQMAGCSSYKPHAGLV